MSPHVRALTADDVDACATLLATLPEWFGIEESNRAYVASLHDLPAVVAIADGSVVGFAAVEQYGDDAAELTVMAVDRVRHGQGIGRALVDSVEQHCRAEGVSWLHVKTRGPSTFDEHYERTRGFYRAVGFTPLYESHTEWGVGNAALVLVKHLACS